MSPMTSPFDGHLYMNIETIRKNGEFACTPVWFVQEGDVFYFRTVSTSGKIKRLRAHPRARIAACTMDGTLLGDWHQVEWMPLSESEDIRLHVLYLARYAEQISALTGVHGKNKLRANQGFALRLIPGQSSMART